jgi:putative addiction module component (TIGR02574 family)
MSIAAEKVAEVLALPEKDRAFLARQLIASLDRVVDADAETLWHDVIDRRSCEIDEGKVNCKPVEEVLKGVRAELNPRRQPS